MRRKTAIAFLLCASALGGCGSGSGGTGATSSRTPGSGQQVVLKLSTQGAVASRAINGVQATIDLPAGVTIAADATTGKIDLSVLTASGVAAGPAVIVGGHYAAASSSAGGKGKVILVNTAGFDSGEFANLTCSVASGSSLTSADFTVTDAKAVDQNGAAIPGVTVTVAMAGS
jgi:hypothetical protein